MTAKEQFIALVSNDQPAKSDAVILLEGDGFNRIPTACRLVKEGLVEKLVFSGGIDNPSYGSYIFEKCLPYIKAEGINADQIVTELSSQHTREQAAFVIDLCLAHNWEKIILVASHYHQYRAFLTFLKVLEERGLERKIRVINVAAQPDWAESTPWGRRIDLLDREFEKIETYKKQGHIASYENAVDYLRWRMAQTENSAN